MGNDSPSQNNGLKVIDDEPVKPGWKGIEVDVKNGLLGMMHDGDQ